MSVTVIVAADDVEIPVRLKKNGVVFDIPLASTVNATLITTDYQTSLITPVVCNNAHADADWPNSYVIVEFTSLETSVLTEGNVILEVQVDDDTTGKKTTWFGSIRVMTGTIA